MYLAAENRATTAQNNADKYIFEINRIQLNKALFRVFDGVYALAWMVFADTGGF